MKRIEIRKDLTDEWKRHGLTEGHDFATLKENLRDNMTNKELVLNMLAELSTTEISNAKNPTSFLEHSKVAKEGGAVAKNARLELERKTGKKVVTL